MACANAAIHVSDILLQKESMDETFTIPNITMSEYRTNNSKTFIRSNLFCCCSCVLTVIVIIFFGFLFGPLVLKNAQKITAFNASQIIVQHYRLRLRPHEDNTFSGRATIVFTNTRRTMELHLIGHDILISKLNITTRQITNVANMHLQFRNVTNIRIKKVQLPPKGSQICGNIEMNQTKILITLRKPLEIGSYAIDILYMGLMNSTGLQKTSQFDQLEGNILVYKPLIVLNNYFKVFPVFDPNQRVRFQLSVARNTDVVCLSNVPIQEYEFMNGIVWDHFRTTALIPPKSLALIIGDYKSQHVMPNDQHYSEILLQMHSPRIHIDDLKYARRVFPVIFEHFYNYFPDIYPGAKLDLVLVDGRPMTSQPGLITISGEDLLLTAGDDQQDQRAIFSTLSEAIALQWLEMDAKIFDNPPLVQGLAKYLAFHAENLLVNDTHWNSEEYYVADVVEQSLNNRIIMQLNGDDQGLKVASVLRMIGPKNIISPFNNNHSMSLLSNWMLTPGYPIVTMEKTIGWNLRFQQESILSNIDLFTIPIHYITENSLKVQNFTLSLQEEQINFQVPTDKWILLNYNRNGYYRVNYDQDNWQKLIAQLQRRPTMIPATNRAQLINDAFALAAIGRLAYHTPFALLTYLRAANETNYMPWRAAIESLNSHEPLFLDSSQYGLFRKFKIDMLTHLWAMRNKGLEKPLQELIEEELCRLQFKPCVDEALDAYDTWQHRKDIFIPKWVYCTALMSKQDEDFDFVFDRLQNSANQREVIVLLESLTCSTVSWKINSYLQYSLNHAKHAKYIWRAMARHSFARLAGMSFIETHFNCRNSNRSDDQIITEEVLQIIVEEFLPSMSGKTNLYTVQKFYMQTSNSMEDSFHIAILSILKRLEWSRKYFDTFVELLQLNEF